jgi:hypothetical protein
MKPSDTVDIPTSPPSVTYATCTDRAHLAPLLVALAEGVVQAPVARERIVLVVPDVVRAELGWPPTSTPIARVHAGLLVFEVRL